MGSRANIAVTMKTEDGSGKLFIYSHWGGSDWQADAILAGLENGRSRWDDPEYFGRIFVQTALEVGGARATDPLGWGLSLRLGDNSYPIPEVDTMTQHVVLENGDSKPFSEVLALSPHGLRAWLASCRW